MLAVMGIQALRDFISSHAPLFVLTGAGCSTDSGIPDYRDTQGQWKRRQPVMFQDFMLDPATRKRYWARSLVGWRHFRRAAPNDAHRALAQLESSGHIGLLVTQNVDRLHQAAGSANVLDLHGRVDVVRCMACENRKPREQVQEELLALNPDWADLDARTAPDGDADLENVDFAKFSVPDCHRCGGTLKPDVVFFGESVPTERVESAMQALEESAAMLVVGSSLMVYSGYRFAQAASAWAKPIAAINLGRTRADDLLTLKVAAPCATTLRGLSAEAHLERMRPFAENDEPESVVEPSGRILAKHRQP
jgi:NAD-dependent SIR2 family protein deacetylase